MSIPFEVTKEHKVFQRTFLARVGVILYFNSINESTWSQQKEELVRSFILNRYGKSFDTDFLHKAVSIQAEDGNLTIVLMNGCVMGIVDAENYRSFEETAIPQIFRLREFLEDVLDVRCVSKLILRKLNIWRFSRNDSEVVDEEKRNELLNFVFSKALLGMDSDDVSESDAKFGIFKILTFEDADFDCKMNLALNPVSGSDKTYNVVLDTSIIYENNRSLDGSTQVWKTMNQYAYDAFLWSVSDNVKAIMNGTIK